ncbi:hypothetical protein EVAR_69719_1 [Eumeta japonica]|uniref:Uncharacterized protein n=1 Tax=Eumeta variegata TaxID=151549 RepID=A0A4C2AAJ5_EUMVA|nr:hypothetical protein EVAR_69719_1 [Eumeta japonica]
MYSHLCRTYRGTDMLRSCWLQQKTGHASNANSSHTFDSDPDPTLVFVPNPVVNFGPSTAFESDFSPVRDSFPRPAPNSDSATSRCFHLDEARGNTLTLSYRSRAIDRALLTRYQRYDVTPPYLRLRATRPFQEHGPPEALGEVVCGRCLELERIGRWTGREIARSALSLARSAQAERDNESCFFVRAAAFIDL